MYTRLQKAVLYTEKTQTFGLKICMLCDFKGCVYTMTVLPLLRFFRAFSSVVRQIPGYISQRQGTARTLPKLMVLFCVLFVCKCVLYYCHRLSTQLQLTNMSICLCKFRKRSTATVTDKCVSVTRLTTKFENVGYKL